MSFEEALEVKRSVQRKQHSANAPCKHATFLRKRPCKNDYWQCTMHKVVVSGDDCQQCNERDEP